MSDQQGQPFVPQQPQPGYQAPQQPQPGYPPQQPVYQAPQQPQPGYPPQQPAYQAPQQPTAAKSMSGVFDDAATLVASGLLVAIAFAIVAGFINFLGDPGPLGGFRERLLALTLTVDVGDIALLGVAVAMLVLTPDPPGGIPRKVLLLAAGGMSAIITLFGVIRALVVLTAEGEILFRFAAFVATSGLVLAAATIAFFAMKQAATRNMSNAS